MTTDRLDFSSLARISNSAAQCSADIRCEYEHFQVEEVLPFEPDHAGGHVWLNIEKRGVNTDWLSGQLAQFSGVAPVAVGYAGLKDRHAVTRQWFSVNLEGKDEPNWAEFETEQIKIISKTRHGKKLRRGVLSGNHFKLVLSHLQGDTELWQTNLERISREGVANYFGEQRFGHQGGNLNRVEYWFSTGKAPRKRNQKSIYLSSARSWLFNLVLSERIRQDNWNKSLAGDVMLLAGTKASLFMIEQADNEVDKRVQEMDIHPTGVMWGRGIQQNSGLSLQLETDVLAEWEGWRTGLEKAGLSQERRALRLYPDKFRWQFLDNQQLALSFFLPAGSYATAVMRELATITDKQHSHDDKISR